MKRQFQLRFRRTRNLVKFLSMVTLILCIGTGFAYSKELPPVKIGAAGPFTGDLSKIGLDALNAIQMAVEEANAEGGIDVYKRQTYESSIGVPDLFLPKVWRCEGLAKIEFLNVTKTRSIDGEMRNVLDDISAVSYTHLDVYKRQVWHYVK